MFKRTTLFTLMLCSRVLSFPTTIEPRTVTNTSKAGLAWGGPNGDATKQYQTTGKVSWYYTWSPAPIPDTSLEFVPMLWGTDQLAQWNATINQTIADSNGAITAVLGFNEPQQTGQSNLTPQQGADLWKQYIEPLHAQGIRLGSPAPSSAPSGLTWLQDFLTACDGGCTVDFIALHWYDVNATAFEGYLVNFHNTFQRPLWITEWDCENFNGGPQCTQDQINSFMNTTQGFMDQTDWVERYAWFAAATDLQGVNPDNAIMNSAGQITGLGEQYICAGGPNSGDGLPSINGEAPAISPHTLPLVLLLFSVYLLL